MIIFVYKKGDRKEFTNYRGISVLNLPGKVHIKCLERKCREIVESKLKNGQFGFRPNGPYLQSEANLREILEVCSGYLRMLRLSRKGI